MKVANDETYLYVYLRVSEEIKLVNMTPTFKLTPMWTLQQGYEVQEGFGSELGIDFAVDHFAYYNVEPDVVVNFYDIGFHPHCDKHSVRISPSGVTVPDGVHQLFQMTKIRLLFRNSWRGLTTRFGQIHMNLRKTLRPSSPLLYGQSESISVRTARTTCSPMD